MQGTYEPNEEECEWPSDSEDEETELSDGVKEKVLVKETVIRVLVLLKMPVPPY
jgi:hypothetical protein